MTWVNYLGAGDCSHFYGVLQTRLLKLILRYMETKTQFTETVGDIMSLMAPSAGGTIPDEDSEEYAQWLLFIQMKYEEASKRGFWRRLLKKDYVELTEGDTQVYLPIDFQRPNSLYIAYIGGVDLSDPDREPDGQGIFVEMDTDPFEEDDTTPNTNFGRWRMTFTEEIGETETAPIWYSSTPPKPVEATDKVLLPGDMIAFGALAEVFRTTNLAGSQDDARQEYENRMNGYLALEMVPSRGEILSFVTNPAVVDRLVRARRRWSASRRNGRV